MHFADLSGLSNCKPQTEQVFKLNIMQNLKINVYLIIISARILILHINQKNNIQATYEFRT